MKRKDRRAQRLAAYRRYSLRWRRVGDIPYEVDVAWKSERGLRSKAQAPRLSDLALLLLMEPAHKLQLDIPCLYGYDASYNYLSRETVIYNARADILWRRAARKAKLSPGEPLTGGWDS